MTSILFHTVSLNSLDSLKRLPQEVLKFMGRNLDPLPRVPPQTVTDVTMEASQIVTDVTMEASQIVIDVTM